MRRVLDTRKSKRGGAKPQGGRQQDFVANATKVCPKLCASSNAVVANGAFAWDDLGSWTALGSHLKHDAEGNAAVADFIHVDAARSKDWHTPVAVVGLRNSILVQTDDAVLLAHTRARRRKSRSWFDVRIRNQ